MHFPNKSRTTTYKLNKNICLAIVITTFNREKELLRTLKILSTYPFNRIAVTHAVKIIVINNGSKNIESISSSIIVYQNPNLGGSGGFARGLYEASKDPSITHCLFMDDDASCDIKAIIKTVELLSSSGNPNLAIAGCMAYDHKPWLLSESGARMRFKNMSYYALNQGLDLRHVKTNRIINNTRNITYGGWWFYAFPIRQTPYYPFPFFVRGDDILFGIMNPHNIRTNSRIISYQMDFRRKYTPWVIYLVSRASFVHGSYRMKRISPLALLVYFNLHVLRYALSYRYTMALAIIEAFKDGNKGLSFWRENIDAKEPMNRIKSLSPSEEYFDEFTNLASSAIETTTHLKKKSYLRRFYKLLTLNGHLIPSFVFKNKSYAVSETTITPMGYTFCRKRLIMINETTGKTMILKHSKKLFFSIVFKMTWLSLKSIFTLKKTMKAYQKGIPSMCTREFWEGVFEEYGCFDEENN